jgi:tRNA (cytidine/uridine-2'-O-)-methyltransferase
MIRLALFQPEIPQNTGTLLRVGSCLGVPLDIIDPCGFPFGDRALRRAGMDYLQDVEFTRHMHWQAFWEEAQRHHRRLIALTPQASYSYVDFNFTPQDTLILGQESVGFPPAILAACPQHICIPMRPHKRSLNVAIAGSMVLGEALRQCKLF